METNIKELVYKLRQFADDKIYPAVMPDYDVYSDLINHIDMLHFALIDNGVIDDEELRDIEIKEKL